MKARDIIGLGIALVLALGIALLSRLFFTEEPKVERVTTTVVEEAKSIDVLVASKTMSVGTRLSRSDVRWQPWPDSMIDAAYITKGEVKISDVEGSIVRYAISQGEPFTLDDLVRPGDRSSLAAVLEEGKRGMSIDVNAATASHGLVHPGDFVDVILSKTSVGADGISSQAISEVIVSNVRVMAVDNSLGGRSNDGKILKGAKIPKTVTLELSPRQVDSLAKATKEGELFLSLHSLMKAGKGDLCKEESCQEEELESYTITVMRGPDKKEISIKAK